MIIFNYHKGTSNISKAILLFSKYSHVSIQIGEYIYEAHIDTGVRKVLLSEWDNSTVVDSNSYFVNPKREKRIQNWAEKQVGKKYDLLGVFSFLWIFLEQGTNKWYCSELAFVIYMKMHEIDSRYYNQRKTPGDLWEIQYIVKNNDF